MSDVSGIPYMGPMGQGNFFAPSFSYNPQMSAGQIQSSYMPEASQGQSVLNNLYGGGPNAGFGQLTNYYSQQVANSYGNINANYGGRLPAAGTFSDYNAGGAWPSSGGGGGGGGGGASPYQSSSSVWDTGASPFYGGGGSSGFGGNIYDLSSSLFGGATPNRTSSNVWDTGASGFQYPGAGSLDWGNLFSQSQQQQSPFSAGNLGAGMFGGLAGGMGGANQGPSNQIDWSNMFGGGGARADPGTTMPGGLNSPMSTSQQPSVDPYPGMTMPGGLNSPMTAQQQQPIDFGSLFGRGAGGTGAPGGTPFDVGAAPITGTQDTGPYGGGGAGIGGLDTGRAIGAPYTQAAEPQRGLLQEPVTEAYNPYYGVTSPYGQGAGDQAAGAPTDTRTGGALTPGGGLTATDLSAQARARLAELMNPPKEPSPDEVFAGDKPVSTEGQPTPAETAPASTDPYAALPEAVPLPAARPEGADVPRPSAALGTTGSDLGYLPGRSARDLQGVNPRFAKALAEYARQYNAGQDQYDLVLRSGLRSAGQGFHTSGKAVDINLVDRSNGERLTDYQTRDPVVFKAYQDNANQFHQFLQQNYPDLAAQHRWGGYFWDGGPGQYGSQDIMHHDLGGSSMGAGSWAGGLGQQAADAYGLPYGGGTKTPYPSFNFDWSNAPIKDVGPMPLTYKSPGGGSVYQIDPDTGQRVNVPIISAKNPSELSSRDFVPAAAGQRPAEAPPLPAEGPATQTYPGADAPRPPADIPAAADVVPLPTARPAAANIAQANSLLDTTVGNLVQKNSPSDVSRVPSSIATQTLREALGNTMTGGLIRSGIEPYLSKLGVTPAEFDKAYAQGQSATVPRFVGPSDDAGTPTTRPTQGSTYWNIPKEGTPEWNQQVYEPYFGSMIMRRPENQTIGGASSYSDFRRSGDVEDRRNEYLTPEQRASLPQGGRYLNSGPEPAMASNPLSSALGLGDLPTSRDTAPVMGRIRSIADNAERDELANVIGPRGSAFGFDPGGFGAGGYGNTFVSAQMSPSDSGYDPAIFGGGRDPNAQIDLNQAYGFPGAPDGGASFNERFSGDSGMADFRSPANDYSTFQQTPRTPYDQYSDELPLNLAANRQASIRNNNPGAQYPGSIADMYGATGQQSLLGGKYKIATFDTPIAGAAANFENLSRNYIGMPIGAAISKWSGNLRNTVPGYPSDMVITPEMVRDPNFAIPFLKAVAAGEAQGEVHMSPRDWQKAHGMFTGQYP